MVILSTERMRDNVERIRARIADAAARSGRDASAVTLIGVTKFQPLSALYAALDCGISIFGENRVQEREQKHAEWARERTTWHMIGHLQRNKARKALALFDCIQSVDGLELATALDRVLGEGETPSYPVLVEVNTSGEESKNGVSKSGAVELVERVVSECERLRVDGLMTIGPLSDDEWAVRGAFAALRDLRDDCRRATGLALPHLSMGMSGDFEWAIEEGGTMVRIGTSIFGARGV